MFHYTDIYCVSEASFFTQWYTLVFKIYFQWRKAEEKLERELREAEASESTEKKLKLVGGFTHSLMLLKRFC